MLSSVSTWSVLGTEDLSRYLSQTLMPGMSQLSLEWRVPETPSFTLLSHTGSRTRAFPVGHHASSWDEQPCQMHGPPAKPASRLPGPTRQAVSWLGPASLLWECQGHVRGHCGSGQAVLAHGG